MFKLKILSLSILALFLGSGSLAAEVFRWAVEKGVDYRVSSYVNEDRYLNGEFHSTIEIRNKAILRTVEVASNGESALYSGDFQYFEREAGRTNLPFELKNIYPSEFWRDRLGRYQIDPQYFMPVVRDVPIFPEHEIKPGDIWHAEAHEVHDLKEYGIDRAYRIPINVRYIYVGDRVINGQKLALFSITYLFSHYGGINLDSLRTRANQELLRYRNDPRRYRLLNDQLALQLEKIQRAPQRINGSCVQLYYWDNQRGVPVSLTEDFHFIFHLLNGEVHEFRGSSAAAFERIKPISERETEKIRRELDQGVGEGLKVKVDPRGVVVELEDVFFSTDSYQIPRSAQAKLKELARRIKEAGDFEIRVEGHTDNSGAKEYNLELSRKRAREVSNLLADEMRIDPRSISWIGYGMSRPVADNRSPEGRAKNRRVEIILLTKE